MKITVSSTTTKGGDVAWATFTQAEHIVHWYFASPEWHCPNANNNLIVGGSFNIRMEAIDQSAGFDFEGTYDEILYLQKISYHLADDREVVTHFESTDEGTLITQTFDTEDMNSTELQKSGWQAILNNYSTYTNNL